MNTIQVVELMVKHIIVIVTEDVIMLMKLIMVFAEDVNVLWLFNQFVVMMELHIPILAKLNVIKQLSYTLINVEVVIVLMLIKPSFVEQMVELIKVYAKLNAITLDLLIMEIVQILNNAISVLQNGQIMFVDMMVKDIKMLVLPDAIKHESILMDLV